MKGCCRKQQKQEEETDWEASGQEEMNRLYAECRRNTAVINARDELVNLRDLVRTCTAALISENDRDSVSAQVAHVLHFYLEPKLVYLEKELARE